MTDPDFHKRARYTTFNDVMDYYEAQDAKMKKFNGFLSGDYEVRFLQDDRLTVCVIRHLKKLDAIYSGISVRHPKDKFDAAVGRHKAFKKALNSSMQLITKMNTNMNGYVINIECFDEYPLSLPVSQLQKDYWKRYGVEEK